MNRPPLVLAFSFALLLAACGGGGGGGGGTLPSSGGSTPVPTGTATPAATATPSPTPAPTPTPGAGLALTGPATDPAGDWGPPGVAASLHFPVQSGFDGTGQTIAVVIDSDVSRSDLAAFFQYFQIPTTSRTITTQAVPPLAAPKIVPGSQDEATLDVETVAGLAPGANVIIYQIPSLTDQNITDAYNQIISDKKAYVVNSSFGGCETPNSPEDVPLQAGAQAGVAFSVSAGDDGNVCDNTTTPMTVGPGYPASSVYAIGVGGSETNPPNFTLTSNTVWNDFSCGSHSQCAGSGGVSSLYAIPPYQQGLAGISSTTMRNEPDISMPAEDAGIMENGSWTALSGTSWSAPEYSALMAEVYEYCKAGTGIVNPVAIPYYVFAHNPAPSAFIDVTSGNDTFANTSPSYTAAAGYDDASGIGVPLGQAFAQTACPGRVPASGLIARARMSLMNAGVAQHTGAFTIDVTPRVSGISDEGVRGAGEPTSIQIVLQPAADVASNEANVVSALQTAGFTITQRFANHLVVDAVAPSATVERFFRTRMHNVRQGRYGTRYLPTTQIVVPDSIAPYVATVNLDDVVTRHNRLIP